MKNVDKESGTPPKKRHKNKYQQHTINTVFIFRFVCVYSNYFLYCLCCSGSIKAYFESHSRFRNGTIIKLKMIFRVQFRYLVHSYTHVHIDNDTCMTLETVRQLNVFHSEAINFAFSPTESQKEFLIALFSSTSHLFVFFPPKIYDCFSAYTTIFCHAVADKK